MSSAALHAPSMTVSPVGRPVREERRSTRPRARSSCGARSRPGSSPRLSRRERGRDAPLAVGARGRSRSSGQNLHSRSRCFSMTSSRKRTRSGSSRSESALRTSARLSAAWICGADRKRRSSALAASTEVSPRTLSSTDSTRPWRSAERRSVSAYTRAIVPARTSAPLLDELGDRLVGEAPMVGIGGDRSILLGRSAPVRAWARIVGSPVGSRATLPGARSSTFRTGGPSGCNDYVLPPDALSRDALPPRELGKPPLVLVSRPRLGLRACVVDVSGRQLARVQGSEDRVTGELPRDPQAAGT